MKINILTKEPEGKVAIMAGAASGISLLAAILFHSRGVKVIAGDYNDKISETTDEHERIVVLHAEVTNVATAHGRFNRKNLKPLPLAEQAKNGWSNN